MSSLLRRQNIFALCTYVGWMVMEDCLVWLEKLEISGPGRLKSGATWILGLDEVFWTFVVKHA